MTATISRLAATLAIVANAMFLSGELAAREIDEARAASLGIRKIAGNHLTLYTDLPASEAVDGLPAVFDKAVPLWQRYFDLPEAEQPWRMRAFLMRDRERFRTCGLLPDDLPDFRNGYARGDELWFVEQSTDYYRRHLLLHEGVHGLMHTRLGGVGPAWYAEGIAELLGTHRLADGQLTLPYFPANKLEAPDWGRVKLVADSLAAGRRYSAGDMLSLGARGMTENEYYGWCWAFCAFLDGHPRYQARFRELRVHVTDRDFNSGFRAAFNDDWDRLNHEWDLFIGRLEYGYDISRNAIEFSDGEPLSAAKQPVTVRADRGWQSTGVRVDAGKKYKLTAAGRFQVAHDPKPWISEPQGVSIRYVDGRPLGMLLAAVLPDEHDFSKPSPLLSPTPIGARGVFTPSHAGVLYLRINDSPAELADNAGELRVTIEVE